MNLFLLFGVSALAFAWLIAGHYFPWASAQQEHLAAAGALLFGAAALFARRLHWPSLSLVALFAAGVPVVQWQLGQIRFASDALLASGYLAGFALCICAGATLARERQVDVAGLVLGALGAAALACAGIGLFQWVDQGTGVFIDAVQIGGRIYANFAQPNHLSTALLFGICAILLAHARAKVGTPVAVLALAFLGWGLVMTQSRTGWLAAALLSVGLLMLRRRAVLRVAPGAVIAALALLVLGNWVWAPLNDMLLLSMHETPATRLTAGSLRWTHWQVMLDAIVQRPWIGYGWTQAALAQQAAVASYPATGEMLTNSHNVVLDLLAWNGVPIGLFLVACLAWWFIRQVRLCTDAERVYPLAAVGVMLTHALLEFPLDYAYFLFPTGLLIGALDAMQPHGPSGNTARSSFVAPLAALAALFALSAYEYFGTIDQSSRTLRFVASGIGTDKVSRADEPDVILMDRVRNLHRFILTPARVDSDPAYLPWVRDVAMRHAFPPAMLRHALAAGLNGQPGEAEQVLIRICKMHPASSCEQGRRSWGILQEQHPTLRAIPYPPTPPELGGPVNSAPRG